MGEEIASCMLSHGETSVIEDVSDSNSSTHPSWGRKRARDSNNICTSKFKGVVPQQNGHWGCQIYANHQRIWLGTFKSEKEAAMAYDSAAIKLRSGDTRRNVPLTDITVEEPNFQSCYSTEAVLSMIKDGTYQSKFADFVSKYSQSAETEPAVKHMKAQSNRGLTCKQLFRKELTPSDVGKLNRLVVPKKFAVKFFPCISENVEENEAADKVDDVQLAFYDRSMKLWEFRYCYWRSSQSFVFTRGWSRFVKEKQLKANDTIAFSLCECRENAEATTQTFYMIDVLNGESSSSLVKVPNQRITMESELHLQLGPSIVHDRMEKTIKEEGMICTKKEQEGMMGAKAMHDEEKKGFKLFGVQIL